MAQVFRMRANTTVTPIWGRMWRRPLPDQMRMLKASSSKWINDHGFDKGQFNWQEGYGSFSYSKSQRNSVIKYIMNQEAHHKNVSFRAEYLDLLKEFEIPFEDHYLCEFYD
jgi:hypothetical protein